MGENTSIDVEKISKYKIYFYSEPYFLILDKNSIIDINLQVSKDKTKTVEIKYSDDFFDLNLDYVDTKDWSLTVQEFDEKGKFTSQIDIYGENLKIKKNKSHRTLILEYNQITNNNGWASIPKVFESAEDVYQKSKQSYKRDLAIKNIFG